MKDWSVEQVATSIGYSRVHLQKEMKKGDNELLIELLKNHHYDILQSVSREGDGIEVNKDQPQYKKTGTDDRYLRLLEDNDRFFKDLVKSNLSKADYVQHAILAHLKSIIQRDAEAQSSGDEKQQKKIMLAMGKRIAYYMEQPVETDIVPGK